MELYQYEKNHAAAVRELAAECAVLLKKDGRFPLAAPGKLALYGSGARRTVRGGTGSGEVNSHYFVTVEQGLENAGFIVTTKAWLDAYDRIVREASKAFKKEIRARARARHTMAVVEGMGAVMPEPDYELPLDGAGDAAVYVLARISGEGSDRSPVRGDVLLTDTEIRDILALNGKYREFMLVLNVGGPVDLSPVRDVKNILLLSQLGVETGNTLADLLLGKSCPSGKLTTTWAAWEDYPSVGSFGERDETRYREGVFVGYRYFDSVGRTPLFPFGFGLGYAEFETAVDGADETGVQVSVRNTGKYPGKETVQLYIAPPCGGIPKPRRTLVAFAKTGQLQPGEAETLRISYDLRDAASYDEGKAAFVLEAGDYTLLVNERPALTLCLAETVVTRQLKNLLGKPDFTDWRPETPGPAPSAETVLPFRPAISAETVCYAYSPPVEPEIAALSDEDLVKMTVGNFDFGAGFSSMIGNSGVSVAGAAGETAHVGQLPFLVMADGPAGLRISRDYTKDAKGVRPVGPPISASDLEHLWSPAKFLLNLICRPKKSRGSLMHQYCTAIPIGTAIAQSWNTDLAEKLGDLVGDEMERFGVHLWLAPALNIHRSILCGRNFEYYSEDPLISGKFAAAITRGVQKHPGCGTTVKHFAANSQERNRTGSNSQVSERALREIYLRGFEICIRESSPCALMTSYNLLNGIHTAERRDLCVDILRCEWGYQGIVMTDWVTDYVVQDRSGVHRNSLSDCVAAAGGSLFMPGSRKDWARVMKALRAGSVTRRQLEENAGFVLRTAKLLTEAAAGKRPPRV